MKKIMFNDRYGLTRLVLSGKKTMTRRIIPFNIVKKTDWKAVAVGDFLAISDGKEYFTDIRTCSQYHVGDIVAVAQSYKSIFNEYLSDMHNHIYDAFANAYIGELKGKGYNNKMFVRSNLMPHCVIIKKVEVQQMQSINEEDCMREGVQTDTEHFQEWQGQHGFRDFVKGESLLFKSRREAFAALVSKVGKKSDWESNPWVFVYTFELCS